MSNHTTYRCSHCGFILYEQKGRCPHCNVLLMYESPQKRYQSKNRFGFFIGWILTILFSLVLITSFLLYIFRIELAVSNNIKPMEFKQLISNVFVFGLLLALSIWMMKKAKNY